MVGYDSLPPLNVTNLTCRDDFFERNFTCLPRCNGWNERPQGLLSNFDDALRLTCGLLDLILTGFFLLAFFIRRKILWVYHVVHLIHTGIQLLCCSYGLPVLPITGLCSRQFSWCTMGLAVSWEVSVYWLLEFNHALLTCTCIASLEVIGSLGSTKLYCSSMDAIETLASPTFYCIFQGLLVTYISVLWASSMTHTKSGCLHVLFLWTACFRSCRNRVIDLCHPDLAVPHLLPLLQDNVSHICTEEWALL